MEAAFLKKKKKIPYFHFWWVNGSFFLAFYLCYVEPLFINILVVQYEMQFLVMFNKLLRLATLLVFFTYLFYSSNAYIYSYLKCF